MPDPPRNPPGEYAADAAAADDDYAAAADDDAADAVELEAEVAGLRRALETRPTIDLAKGMVMQRYSCNSVAAFALLRRVSQEHNVKIRHLAAAIVARIDEDGVEPPPDEVVPIAARLFDGVPEEDAGS